MNHSEIADIRLAAKDADFDDWLDQQEALADEADER